MATRDRSTSTTSPLATAGIGADYPALELARFPWPTPPGDNILGALAIEKVDGRVHASIIGTCTFTCDNDHTSLDDEVFAEIDVTDAVLDNVPIWTLIRRAVARTWHKALHG